MESGAGVVAAIDRQCSEVGTAALRAGGDAVDAAVATTLCLGVVHPMSSGVGVDAFIVVRGTASSDVITFNARETAQAAATSVRYCPMLPTPISGKSEKENQFFFFYCVRYAYNYDLQDLRTVQWHVKANNNNKIHLISMTKHYRGKTSTH